MAGIPTNLSFSVTLGSMTSEGTDPKVVHFFDCADVGKTLVKYGREAGHRWRYRPWLPESMRPLDRKPTFPVLTRAQWSVRRTLEAVQCDVMHIHFGTRTGAANSRPYIPFVMHWHGTDIRKFSYQAASKPAIEWGARRAAHVVYATPDLRPHAHRLRPDATYLPIPVDFMELPMWRPEGGPKVIFSSRWDESKGGSAQLELLRDLRAQLGKDVVFEGLDWGGRAEEARALGVRLVPRMPKAQFLEWLSRAHCVVGQTSGILATSELEAVAMGAPTVIEVGNDYYPDSPFPTNVGRDGLVARVSEVLEDPLAAAQASNAAAWVRQHHGPESLIPQLAAIYRSAAGR